MNGKVITSICFKLCAIYLIVNVLISIPSIFTMLSMQLDTYSTYPISLTLMICLSPIVIAWLVSRKLWLAANDVIHSFSEEPIGTMDIEDTLYRVLGVFFVVSALTMLPSAVMHYINYLNKPNSYLGNQIGVLFSPAVELVLGLLLTLKANGIATFFKKLKYAGT